MKYSTKNHPLHWGITWIFYFRY